MKKLALVGAGKMGTAIARGLIRNEVWPREGLAAADVSAPARSAFEAATGVVVAGSAEGVVSGADVVLVAVKPQVAAAAVPPLKEACRGALVVSIMAGVTLARLGDWLGGGRIVRVMPNTPLTVGKGASVFACGPDVSEADRETVRRIFGALGIVYEMGEEQLDAVTALSGSGPAYVFEMIQALADAAVAVGLPPDEALALTAQTVAGAAEMVQQGLGSPDELRIAVTSPGGTTAAGLAVLGAADFRGLIRDVLRAARDRSVELGKSAG